ncbi:DMT family transporter [Curvivirga aplysinae]|uniref:DMT family transporter n=1 Tax=Curvivirga aplysinae TaxID=2529852 RepID=UPI001C3F5C97|nr:DMT family transporter [Curvivirga aplysinae]
MNAVLYLSTILIWGTTWLAIAFQIGEVAVEVSVFYRFALAAICQIIVLILLKKLNWVPFRQHGWMMIQGLLLFCVNFLFFYNATKYIPSGFVSVVFSMATIFNLLNGFVVLRRMPPMQSVIGALIGVCGIIMIFWPDLTTGDWRGDRIIGLALATAGTFCFSLGNLVSQHQQKQGRNVLTANSYALVYGSSALLAWCMVNGYEFNLELTGKYLGSLFYLATIGTIVGFGCYLALVGRIGPDRAAYCTVLFPIVALTLSTIFEGYEWTILSISGVMITLLGNVIVFSKFKMMSSQLVKA